MIQPIDQSKERKCIICSEYETTIRERHLLCGDAGSGYSSDDFSIYGNGRHHFVMTKQLQKDIDKDKKQL